MHKQPEKLKKALDRLYQRYNHHRCIKPDPLQFVYKYTEPADMEIAAFVSALLAYGRVSQIQKSLTSLFALMHNSPLQFVTGFDGKNRARLNSFKHRFTTGRDIADLFDVLKVIYNRYESLEKFFLQGYSRNDKNIVPALQQFSQSLLHMHAAFNHGRISKGLRYLLPTPAKKSACKRLNLFLRWMVRNDAVDTGLWKGVSAGRRLKISESKTRIMSIDKAKLLVPVDVHAGRLCRALGLYNRKTACLSAALEITKAFAEIESADPVKYDFALTRVGIVEHCTGKAATPCRACLLSGLCTVN